MKKKRVLSYIHMVLSRAQFITSPEIGWKSAFFDKCNHPNIFNLRNILLFNYVLVSEWHKRKWFHGGFDKVLYFWKIHMQLGIWHIKFLKSTKLSLSLFCGCLLPLATSCQETLIIWSFGPVLVLIFFFSLKDLHAFFSTSFPTERRPKASVAKYLNS